jgi:hypothetical protein
MKIDIGTKIESAEQWDALPMGSELKDGDGWIHTKIADSDNDIARSSYVVPEDPQHTGKFFQPWEFDTVLVSTPEAYLAKEGELDEVYADLALVRAELTKQKRRTEVATKALKYAQGLLEDDDARRVDGYVDALTDATP